MINKGGFAELILAVRTSKYESIKLQLASILGVEGTDIFSYSTCYTGIMLLELDNTSAAKSGSIRNIEALLIDGSVASELQYSPATKEISSFQSLNLVAIDAQYEHLSQLLHIQKATRARR